MRPKGFMVWAIAAFVALVTAVIAALVYCAPLTMEIIVVLLLAVLAIYHGKKQGFWSGVEMFLGL